MSISQDETKLIAIFVQSCLWGAFTVMFVITYWTLVHNRPIDRSLNKSMLGIAILMYVLATAQLGVNCSRIIRGLILLRDSPTVYWDQMSDTSQVFGSTMFILQTFVGDGVAVYRTFVVWSRRIEFILVPSIIYAGGIVSGTAILVIMGRTAYSPIFAAQLAYWITSFFACTLATSTVCTLLISSRIWYLGCNSISEQFRGTFRPAARVIFESGAIYSGVLLALLILYLADSWFQYVLVDCVSPLIGIVFSIIIVRIGLGVATDPETIRSDRVLRPLWEGSGTAGQVSHELGTFAALRDIEQGKDRESQCVGITISTYTTKFEGEGKEDPGNDCMLC